MDGGVFSELEFASERMKKNFLIKASFRSKRRANVKHS